MGAPMGIRHGKASVEFQTIQTIRHLHQFNRHTPKMLATKFGYPLDTIRDWIYRRTRVSA